jgi:hypothetical protein
MMPGFKLERIQPLRDDTILSGPLQRRGPGFLAGLAFLDSLDQGLLAG